MFSTAARGGKSFAAMKKLGELKKRIFTLKAIEKKFSTDKRTRPYEIIKKLVENMINLPNAKYKQVPNDVEKNVLRYDPSRERFTFVRLEKINREKYRLERFDKKNLPEKKAQVKTFASSGRFTSVDNKSYFHKQETFLITNKQNIDEEFFYWLKSTRTEKKIKI